jgi:hypothetical protein
MSCNNEALASSGKAAVMSVSMNPGATQLTRMPRLARLGLWLGKSDESALLAA